MATPFTSIYGYIRTLLGDTDVTLQKWTNDVIADAIRMALLGISGYSASGVSVEPTIVDDNDMIIVAGKSAMVLLSPTPGRFAWKTKNISVSRDSRAKVDTMRLIETMIADAEAGGEDSGFDADHSLTAFLERYTRLTDSINEASV